MPNCSFKITLDSGEEWECPCEALPGEERCYWHKKEECKSPSREMLEELKEKVIFGAFLDRANLQKADLRAAKLQNANLIWSKLQNAYLGVAKMQNANLSTAEMQNTNLSGANLQNADLRGANIQNGNLKEAFLQGTNLHGVRFDSETAFDNATLYDANLYRSYFDEAKSFRHAALFCTENGKEINEIIGDALGAETIAVLDLDKIKEAKPDIAAAILDNEGLVKYARDGKRVVFFDRPSGGLIKNPENRRRREDDTVLIDGLSDLILKDGAIQPEFIYEGSRAEQFEASYEVYNNLYNFYVNMADSTRLLTFITAEERHTESYCERRAGFTGCSPGSLTSLSCEPSQAMAIRLNDR